MKIEHFTKIEGTPDFIKIPEKLLNADIQSVDMDKEHNRLLQWNEQKNQFAVYDFEGKQLWRLNECICCAKFDPRSQQIWLVRYENDELVTLLVYDYQGNKLAEKSMQDGIYDSTFIITLLPENHSIAIDFCGGQDGSQTYFISLQNSQIQIDKELEGDVNFLFAFDKGEGKKAILLNFYEDTLFLVDYPSLNALKSFTFPEEFYFSDMRKINETLYTLSSGDGRHYLFDTQSFTLKEEIIISGYEAQADETGEVYSNIDTMYYEEGKLIFRYFEITGKYPDTQQHSWWAWAKVDW